MGTGEPDLRGSQEEDVGPTALVPGKPLPGRALPRAQPAPGAQLAHPCRRDPLTWAGGGLPVWLPLRRGWSSSSRSRVRKPLFSRRAQHFPRPHAGPGLEEPGQPVGVGLHSGAHLPTLRGERTAQETTDAFILSVVFLLMSRREVFEENTLFSWARGSSLLQKARLEFGILRLRGDVDPQQLGQASLLTCCSHCHPLPIHTHTVCTLQCQCPRSAWAQQQLPRAPGAWRAQPRRRSVFPGKRLQLFAPGSDPS